MHPKGLVLVLWSLWGTGVSAWAGDYTVQKGDSAFTIAQKAKLSVEVVKRANPEVDWAGLKTGSRLFLPEVYTVKAGDTLYSLCRLWGVDQSAVVTLNALPAGTGLKAGQVLFIPPQPPAKGKGSEAKPADLKPADPKPAEPKGPAAFWPVDRTPKLQGDRLKSVAFATSGEVFRSVSAGSVVFLGEFRGVGRVLIVQGPGKVAFTYGNFEESSVVFGQTVVRGQVLGTTSSRTNQKLIFFASQDSKPLDPLTAQR